jgi:hypothetical protein
MRREKNVLEKISKLSLSSIPSLISFLISNENEKKHPKVVFCTDASLRFFPVIIKLVQSGKCEKE